MSQTLNITIFAWLKGREGSGLLWFRAAIASVLSQIVDTLLFVTIAFYGVFPIGGLIVGQMLAKVVLSAVLMPFVVTALVAFGRRLDGTAACMTDHTPDAALLAKAETLTEALPYLQRYAGQTFVVKYGGHAMGDPERQRDFAEDVVLLRAVGINPVVVHGGGPQIGSMLKRLGVELQFVGGLRVTDEETAQVAEMVLGAINKDIVSWIADAGGRAVGLSGKDAGLVLAEKVGRDANPQIGIERHVDLGFVGEPALVNRGVIDTMSAAGLIPVIAPIARGADGNTYNINADTMAGAVAAALGASRLFLLTDVAGRARQAGRIC